MDDGLIVSRIDKDKIHTHIMSRRSSSSIIFNSASPLRRTFEPANYIMGPSYPSQFMGSPDRAPNPLLTLLPESLRSSASINRGGSFLFSTPGSRPLHEQELLSSQPRRPYLAQIATLRMDPDPRYDVLPSSPSPFTFPPLPQIPMPMLQLRPTLREDSQVKRLKELVESGGQTRGHIGVMR